MFRNYSQTYATQILALAGLLAMLGHSLGWEIAEGDAVFVIGATADVVGIVWALIHRHSKGDVELGGARR